MKCLKVLLLFAFLSAQVYATNKKNKKSKEELIEFDNIQQVLKNDRLGAEVEKKKIVKEKKRRKKLQSKINRFNVPRAQEFWSFYSEYWIVKNATILKWDFKKPDYGIENNFRTFLETLGIYEKRFKILLLNTPNIAHFSLPSDDGETIFLLSVPFIRTLDLSKLEISLLLLEDYLRVQGNYFKNYVISSRIDKFLGSNFFEKKFNKKALKEISEKYDQMIFVKGYNFQQQFQVTKKMSSFLSSDQKLWNAYYRLIVKKDNLVKSNILYQKYLKIYPSPELQLGWLRPKKKVL